MSIEQQPAQQAGEGPATLTLGARWLDPRTRTIVVPAADLDSAYIVLKDAGTALKAAQAALDRERQARQEAERKWEEVVLARAQAEMEECRSAESERAMEQRMREARRARDKAEDELEHAKKARQEAEERLARGCPTCTAKKRQLDAMAAIVETASKWTPEEWEEKLRNAPQVFDPYMHEDHTRNALEARILELEREIGGHLQSITTLGNDALEFRDRAEKAEAELARAREALKGLLGYAYRQTCRHEETHRGGTIWTICDGCGRKWADDMGGMPEYQDPPEIVRAEDALNGREPTP